MQTEYCIFLHAYSACNSGDKLLVELMLENTNPYIKNKTKKILVCIDKKSFFYLKNKYPEIEIISIIEFIFLSMKIAKKETLFIGVGGGYLRSGDYKEGIKCLLSHGLQIITASLFKKKKMIYLPQSVGPLNNIFGKTLKRIIKKIDLLYCRDEKTFNELKDLSIKKVKAPDMVASEIIEGIDNINFRIKEEKYYFILRDLKGKRYSKNYIIKIKKLLKKFDNYEIVIQSSSRGNNDINFCKKLFNLSKVRTLKEAITENPGIVISVRLHGSLEAILAGCPSIHLAYERKGLAAYKDMGIPEYAFHCENFEVNEVIDAAKFISNNLDTYRLKIIQSQNRSNSYKKYFKGLI